MEHRVQAGEVVGAVALRVPHEAVQRVGPAARDGAGGGSRKEWKRDKQEEERKGQQPPSARRHQAGAFSPGRNRLMQRAPSRRSRGPSTHEVVR